MPNTFLNERHLIYLTYRSKEAIDEIEAITRSLMWKMVSVHDVAQLEKQLSRGHARVVLVDLRDSPAVFIDRLPSTIRQYDHMQWVGLIEPHFVNDPIHAGFLHSFFFDFCLAPIEPLRLTFSLGHAWYMSKVAEARQPVEEEHEPIQKYQLVGNSTVMKTAKGQLKRYAGNNLPVLITGPSGTGKELAARSLHLQSARRQEPFVAVNCGALTPSLVQSELFGHEKGAFTGANNRKIGWIEAANGGTLLLDEVGDLPPDVQISLLRFLQEGVIERVGGTDTRAVDVRIIAATHVALEQSVAAGQFREDLYFRLNVLRLHMPPLKDRDQDVLALARYYVRRFVVELGVGKKILCPSAEAALLAHDWPGNIRELMNRLRRAIVLSDRHAITPSDLEFVGAPDLEQQLTLSEVRDKAECAAISRALIQSARNVTEAARLLGVSRVTLHRLINKHHLPMP